MLSYILALTVALGSFALYMAAFFFPEVHRKGDFVWSGVGLFYALVLWFCAGRITGAVLLGETASIALLGWFGWQTLKLRREVTPSQERTEIAEPQKLTGGVSQLGGGLTNLFKFKRNPKPAPVPVANKEVPAADIPQPAQIPQPVTDVAGSSVNDLVETATNLETPTSEDVIASEIPVAEKPIVTTTPQPLAEEIEPADQSVPFEEILPPDARPTASDALDRSLSQEKILPPDARPTPAPDALDAPVEEVLNPEIPSVKEAFISAREEMPAAFETVEPAEVPVTSDAEMPSIAEPIAPAGDTEPAEVPVTTNLENMPAAAALEGATSESDTLEEDEFDDEIFEPAPPTTPVKPPQKPAGVKPTQQPRPAKPAAGGGVNQLLAPAVGLISTLQNGVQGLLNKFKKPKTQQETKKSSSTAVSDSTADLRAQEQSPLQVDAVLEVSVVDTVVTDAEIVSEATTIIADADNPDAPVTVVVEELTIQTEPATLDESSTETTDEAPTPSIEIPVDSTASEAETAEAESRLEAIPPNPPSPELVEAAQESAHEVTDSAESVVPIEEIAPEVELAPPAEGSDDENLEVSAEAEPEPAEALDIPPLEATTPESEITSPAPISAPEASAPTAPASVTTAESQPPAPPVSAATAKSQPTVPPATVAEASAPTPPAATTTPETSEKENVRKVMRAGRQDPALVEPAKRSAEAKSKNNPSAGDEGTSV